MSEDAEQPDAVDPADGSAQQTAEVQTSAVSDEVKAHVAQEIAALHDRLVANGQIQPPPSA